MGWKDRDILANREFLRKDAELQWELQQIAAAGPAWKEQALAGELAEGGAAAGGEEAGLGGGAEGAIPDFGGGEAAVGGEEVGVEADVAVEEEPVA